MLQGMQGQGRGMGMGGATPGMGGVNQPQGMQQSPGADQIQALRQKLAINQQGPQGGSRGMPQVGGMIGQQMVGRGIDRENPLTGIGNMLGGAGLMAMQKNINAGNPGGWGSLFGWS